MPVRNIPVDVAGSRVADVMLREPETMPPGATVREAMPLLASPRLRMLLLAEGGRFVGAVPREALEAGVAPETRLVDLVDPASPRVRAEDDVARALAMLEAGGTERLPVVAAGGELIGLVCFNRRKQVFCVDATDDGPLR